MINWTNEMCDILQQEIRDVIYVHGGKYAKYRASNPSQ